MTSLSRLTTLASLCLIMLAGCSSHREYTPKPMTPEATSDALSYCDRQVHRTLTMLAADGNIDYTMMPRNILAGQDAWNLRKADPMEWCGGFWSGVLWYDYEATGDTTILHQAQRFTEALSFLAQRPAYDHDLGFLVIPSFINGYRLTGDERYRQVLLACADTLASLFNPLVGTILSWPRHVRDYGGHNTIIDNMLNLELLFWAARNGGDQHLRQIAISHADTTMAYQFRPDYTCAHVAVYDTLDGHHLYNCTHQGLADGSVWARGQSWAIYGYTMVYRETHDSKYLDFAQKVADEYLKRLPSDMVPYWDFDDPRIAQTPADSLSAAPGPDGMPNRFCPRDASTAAVVASALLELSQFTSEAPDGNVEKADYYRACAEQMLVSLSSTRYQAGIKCPALLLHSTGHHPAGTEIDAAIIYADYYYIEALCRLKALQTKN